MELVVDSQREGSRCGEMGTSVFMLQQINGESG
jgi:hypothetical protein